MKFIKNEAALLFGRMLVIAELHLGIERSLEKDGIKLPEQSELLLEKIRELIKRNRAKELLILGDVKDKLFALKDYEKEEICLFLNNLSEIAKLTIVKGNHDGGIENFIKQPVVKSYKKDATLFIHGHSLVEKIENYEKVVLAHSHPVLHFEDKLGGRTVRRVWVLQKGKPEIVIMPAFNPLLGGTDVREGFLGPIKRLIKEDKAELYLLDGLYLGKISDLE